MSAPSSKRSSLKYIAYKPLAPSQSPFLPSVGRPAGRKFSTSTAQVRRTATKEQLDKRSFIRVVQLILCLLAVSSLLSYPLYMVYTVYGQHEFTVAVGDAVLLNQVSTFWCASVGVRYKGQAAGRGAHPLPVEGGQGELIRLSHRPATPYTWRPKLNLSFTVAAAGARTLQVAVSDDVHIKVQTCAQPRLGLLVFSDVNVLKKWESREYLSKESYAARMEVGCDSSAESGAIVKVEHGGFYFIVVDNRDGDQGSAVKLRVSVLTVRRDFDKGFNKTKECAISPACRLSLAVGLSQVTAVRLTSNSSSSSSPLAVGKLTWSCRARWSAYVGVFGGSAVVVLCAVVALQCLSRRFAHRRGHSPMSSKFKPRNYEACTSDTHIQAGVASTGHYGTEAISRGNPDSHHHGNSSIN